MLAILVTLTAATASHPALPEPAAPSVAAAGSDVTPLHERGLANLRAWTRVLGVVRGFHPSDAGAALDWNAFAIAAAARVEPCADADELAAAMAALLAPVAPTAQVSRTGSFEDVALPDGATHVFAWRHDGCGLADWAGGIGSSARVHWALGDVPDVEGELAREGDAWTAEVADGVFVRVPLTSPADATRSLPVAAGAPAAADGPPRAVRLAGVSQAWSLFWHFHPYLDLVHSDWPGRLDEALRGAATASDARAHRRVLERFVAALEDGHATVSVPGTTPTHGLPFVWEWIEERPIVTAAEEGSQLDPGDEVLLLDGVPALELVRERERHISASTPGYRRARAMIDLTYRDDDAPVTLTVRAVDGDTRDVALAPAPVEYWAWAPTISRGPRPASFSELEPGIVYVDVSSLTADAWAAALPDLESARGLVLDVRRYPRSMVRPRYVAHLVDAPFEGLRGRLPRVPRPDRAGLGGAPFAWTTAPAAPRLEARVVFLSHRAGLSATESHLAVAAASGAGPVVGEATGGTNGNTFSFAVAGGVSFTFTGLEIWNADGGRLHGVGVQPDHRVLRTRAAIAAGEDEVLAAGLEVLRSLLGG